MGFGHVSRWLQTAEVRDLEPNLTINADAEALFAPDDLCINAPHLTRFIADQFRALGGHLQEHCAAQTLLADDDGIVTGLISDQGDLSAPNVLITTGPDTAAVLAQLTGYDGFNSGFPVTKVPGLLLTTPPVAPDLLGRLVYGPDTNEVHILPEYNGGIKIGADDMDGLITEDQSSENLTRVGQLLLERARKLLPALAEINIDDCQLGIGVRAYPKDGVSIAGQMPGAQGLYLIATHSGITLAPAIGQLMAEMITTRQTPKPLEPFALQRFAGFA